MSNYNNNYARITGKVVSEFEKYHTVLNELFYRVYIQVNRRSDQHDLIPVVVSEKIVQAEKLMDSEFIAFTGQIRTHNNENSRVETFLFARDAELADEDTYFNEVELTGFLCKKGRYKETKTDRRLLNFTLAVNRVFGKSDYLTILAWGKDAKYVNSLDVSTKMKIVGRFQSRVYPKIHEDGTKEERVAYEISAKQLSVQSDLSNEVENDNL